MGMRGRARLVEEFASCVVAQEEAMRRGDAKKGNQFADRYVKAWETLRSQGDEGRDALVPLLHDERVSVRVMAAAFLLRYRTKEAKLVLKEAAQGEGLSAFGASQALQRWAEGDWHLDPP
jgi:hypothetical protein